MFSLNNHALTGQDANGHAVAQQQSPNHNGAITPKFLVFHYTACDAAAATNVFLHGKVSAHLLVDRDGSVTQFVPLNLRAWHAGESQWGTRTDLNTHSIGIEVVNYGYLLKTANGNYQTAEAKIAIQLADVIETRHRLAHWPWQYWHAYSAEQIETCRELAELLVSAYALEDVLGHDDIAPSRKADPGPAFPMQRLRGLALGRDSDQSGADLVYVAVDMLNIRKGADTGQPTAAPPLIRNTQLRILDRTVAGWMHVQTTRQPPVEGWVSAGYVSSEVS